MKDNIKNIIIGMLIGIICVLIMLILLVVNGTISFASNNDEVIDSIKKDDSKYYVYDAEYSYDNKYIEYGEGTEKRVVDRGIPFEVSEGKQVLEDLKVPYINIMSNDADTVNGSLKDLYIEAAKNFDLYAEEHENSLFLPKQVLTYRTYQYNDILSIVVIYGGQKTSNWNPYYYRYNFDLNNGKLLNFDDLIKKLGYSDKEEALERIKPKIEDKLDDLFLYGLNRPYQDLSSACHIHVDGKGPVGGANCYEIAYDDFKYTIDNGGVPIIDNNGNLSIFLRPVNVGLMESASWTWLVFVGK